MNPDALPGVNTKKNLFDKVLEDFMIEEGLNN